TYAFSGRRTLPLAESIAEWPLSCGPSAWNAIAHIKRLLAFARDRAWPIIYTVGRRDSAGPDLGKFSRRDQVRADPAYNDIVEDVAPRDDEMVIAKPKPS